MIYEVVEPNTYSGLNHNRMEVRFVANNWDEAEAIAKEKGLRCVAKDHTEISLDMFERQLIKST